ncbi:VOC family protein [Pseudotabrizicola alkalilacus]|uniref:Glyoxalase n=1 Tax=Pseudotabrizicola alkalilacus TaxID=2305252 RepID=A0A411Z325_9RHOB|nr:VOC family protein [Pseudotabrizicola alkalilacus]RGP37469.1 glyoxalase [Pseudotabrizicola alkalilacus]
MPEMLSILETALYVDDLDRAAAFYEGVMGLPVLHADDRMRAYDVKRRSVLLLFLRGGTTAPVRTASGLIPPHDANGQIHMAFAIAADQLEPWRAHLAANDIEIEGTSDWKRGGHSLYFRDPDSNMLEVATTPGLWEGF